MTEPFNKSAVVPFAGLPALAAPSTATLDRHVLSQVPTLQRGARDSLLDAHFQDSGVRHAELLTQRLIDARRSPALRSLDADGAVRAYVQAVGERLPPGERASLDQANYVSALCEHLALHATTYDAAVAAARLGGHTSLDATEFSGLLPTTGLSLNDVSELATEMRDVARSLSAAEGVSCPPLQTYDENQIKMRELDEAVDRLADLIDDFAVLIAVPSLAEGNAQQTFAATTHLAAQIGQIEAASPGIVTYLDEARSKVLGKLLPDTARYDRSPHFRVDYAERPLSLLRHAADRLLARLLHPTQKMTGSEALARADLVREIETLNSADPTVVRTLPPVHAGLVRRAVGAAADSRVLATPAVTKKPHLTLVKAHNNGGPTAPTTNNSRTRG
jgi:hypothetical protein